MGLAKQNPYGGFKWVFVTLSKWDDKVLRIPLGVLHGWRKFTNEMAMLMYHISENYDPTNPDELRYNTVEQVGADWSTPVR